MKKMFSNLDAPKKLGVVAFALGFVALFAGNPYDTTFTKVNAKEVALASFTNSDAITVDEMAVALIKGTSTYRLVDLRPEEEYQKYFLPGAENIPLSKLSEAGLLRNEKILFYDDDNLLAAQAWFLLKSQNYNTIYILKGGMKEWKDKVLFPTLSANATPEEQAEFEKAKEVCKFFGGVPQIGGETVSQQVTELPKVQAPVAPAGGGTKKKKREGC